MAWNNGAPRGWSGIGPDLLNDAYTHGQFIVPCGAIEPGVSDPYTSQAYEPSGTNYPTYRVGEFPNIETELDEPEGFWIWAFKMDFVKVPSINLKFFPLWFVKEQEAAPNNIVQWAGGAFNVLIGTSIDFNNAANESRITQAIKGNNILNGGIVANDQAAIAITVQNDTLSATNINMLNCMIERESNEQADTFEHEAYLLGVVVQFECDFNNVNVWPTS